MNNNKLKFVILVHVIIIKVIIANFEMILQFSKQIKLYNNLLFLIHEIISYLVSNSSS
jgi:hypothetical protein